MVYYTLKIKKNRIYKSQRHCFQEGCDIQLHISGSCVGSSVLTCGVGVASLLGLVPDGHAVILQFEVALFLPGARLDFPHNCPNKHGLEVVIPLDA